MAVLAFTQLAGAVFGNTGRIYRFPFAPTNAIDFDQILLPPNVNATRSRPSFAPVNFNGKSLVGIVGGHTDNVMIDAHYRCYRQGMLPHNKRPTTAAAAGPGPTGSFVGYISFWDDKGRRRSRLSAGSTAVALANQSRTWSNLPAFSPDEVFFPKGTTTVNASTTLNASNSNFLTTLRPGDRVAVSSAPSTYATVRQVVSDTQLVLSAALGNGTTQTVIARRASPATHIELWVSMDGSTPRLAMRVDLGVTTVTESVATLALGEAAPTSFSRFPRCKYNVIFHARQWMCGDSQFPNRIYYSGLNDYENMEGYLETRDGKEANGLYRLRDMLFVGCQDSHQRIQGWTLDDFSVEIAESDVGLLTHHGVVVVHDGYAIVPAQEGFFLNTGSFRSISEHYEKTFCREYALNRAAYENGFGYNMYADKLYKFHVGQHSDVPNAAAVYWVLDYSKLIPEAGGNFSTPPLSYDAYGRTHDCAFSKAIPGSGRREVLIGTCIGRIFKEVPRDDADSTTNDDSDPYEKLLTIDTGVHYLGDSGGDVKDSKEWRRVWAYVEAELNSWTFELRAGRDKCHEGLVPSYTRTVPASQLIQNSYLYVPETKHIFTPDKLVGDGIQLRILVTAPQGFNYRGFGGTWSPGAMVNRGRKTFIE